MKYQHVKWSPEVRDFVPVKRRPSRFMDRFENTVGLILFAVGLVLFVGLMHYLPDSAELAARLAPMNP